MNDEMVHRDFSSVGWDVTFWEGHIQGSVTVGSHWDVTFWEGHIQGGVTVRSRWDVTFWEGHIQGGVTVGSRWDVRDLLRGPHPGGCHSQVSLGRDLLRGPHPGGCHSLVLLGRDLLRGPHPRGCHSLVSLGRDLLRGPHPGGCHSLVLLGHDLLRGPHPGVCHSRVSLGGGRRIVLLWGTSLKIWPMKSSAGIWSMQWLCCSPAVAFLISVTPVSWRWLLQLVLCLQMQRKLMEWKSRVKISS